MKLKDTVFSRREALLLSAGALGLLGLSACGEAAPGTGDAPGTSSSAEASEIKTIEPGKLLVALNAGSKPSSYLDEDNNPAGFIPAIIDKIADNLDLELQYDTVDLGVHIADIANGLYDLSSNGFVVEVQDQTLADFSKPLMYGYAVLVSLRSAPIDTFADAANRTIGYYSEAHHKKAEQSIEGASYVQFSDQAGALNALRIGQIDGFLNGQNPGKKQVQENDDLSLSDPESTGPVALAVTKDNPSLLDAINGQLDGFAADGTISGLYDEFYPGTEISQDLIDAYDSFKS